MQVRKLENEGSVGAIILPTFFLTLFAGGPPFTIMSLLLIEMSQTFKTSIGIMGQINTVSSIAGLFFALLLGALSLKLKQKTLLIVGIICLIISSIGCGLSQSFTSMLFFYSFTGIGTAITLSMTISLIADYFPLSKRTQAIGWVFAGRSIASIIGQPIVGYISALGGWRLAFLMFSLPVSLLSFIMILKTLPSTENMYQKEKPSMDLLEGFKRIFSNKSAVFCLLGGALSMATFTTLAVYNPSFLRQRYLLSVAQLSILMPFFAFSFTIGSITSGKIVNRFGRKQITFTSIILISIILFLIFSFRLSLLMIVPLVVVIYILSGVSISSSNSLSLEQVPSYRSSMMSLNTAATNMGRAMGSGVGGIIFLFYSYEGLGYILGAFSFLAASIYSILVKDPINS
jgi:predicted MFS family arabinose efflux permease